MMDNFELVLSVLLKRVPVQDILTGNFSSADIKRKDFIHLMRINTAEYSETELENLFLYLIYNFNKQSDVVEKSREKLDLFQLLRHYSRRILIEQDNEIVCEYSKFLHWRMITNKLSEDLFVASFVAIRVLKNAAEPVKLNWKAVITHNNWELHKILKQGMAENHSHLKGSSTVFPLTWISLMNNIHEDVIYKQIEEIAQNRRNTDGNLLKKENSLSIQLLQAACIRLLMFEWLCHRIWNIRFLQNSKKYYLWLQQYEDLISIKIELISEIHSIQNTYNGQTLPDYALVGVLEEFETCDNETLIFQGERWLLYHFFYEIYSGVELGIYRELFYAYLVLKENFRAEFVQCNRDVGFENFRIYEKRKDIFLENSFFEKEMVKKAIETSFRESKVMVMETRIAPKHSAKEYYNYIKQLDEWFDKRGQYRNRLFYTVHFIKAEDNAPHNVYMSCRHSKKRQDYQKQAFALAAFREKYPETAIRIKGIDAANMEIGCGPEVFAQVFRYLSDHRVIFGVGTERKIPQLRKTYHVGEDFLDLVSGIRAIDEAVRFLDLRCGDRVGHALALGINAKDWYQSKNYRILLTQQEYLDNIAWMYHWIVDCHLDNRANILNFLIREFEYYFQLIYRNAMNMRMIDHFRQRAKEYYKDRKEEKYYNNGIYEFTIEKYYYAWQLRGDNPELYKEGFFCRPQRTGNEQNFFSNYGVNKKVSEQRKARHMQDIALLYYYYHYNEDVRREGMRTIEKKIDIMYIDGVNILQHEMRKKIAEYGIGIETNPSSNVMIGTFKRYDKHPILNFYNRELTEDEEKLKMCPQISVSINTDDSGIFGTSLENEYAYMALALEEAKDENGNKLYKKRNVYEWLDHIRVMGIRQTFLDDEEMKIAIQEWQ